MNKKSKNIVYISSIPWNYTWHRQQEMMDYLSKKGFNILFVQPVNKRKLCDTKLVKMNNHLYILRVSGLPYERCSYLFNFINGKIQHKIIKKITKKLKWTNYMIWFDRVHGSDLENITKNRYVIYDLIDEITAFGRVKNTKLLLEKENYILKKCDLLISSSNVLLKRKINQSYRKGENLFIPNGVDCKRFCIKKNVKYSKNIVVGFIGTISQRALNYDLIIEMVRLKPNWKYIFIGPGTIEDKSILKKNNILVKDAVDGAKIPKILEKIDIGIIPYNIKNEDMDYVFPRKACEYLAAGLPVVSTPLREIKNMDPYVKTANTGKMFVYEIEDTLKNYNQYDSVNFVRQYDWDNLMNKVIKKIS